MKTRMLAAAATLAALCWADGSGALAAEPETQREGITTAFKVPIANVPGKTMSHSRR